MTEIGKGWFPAVPRSDHERSLIGTENKKLRFPKPFWIGGSTDHPLSCVFYYERYQTNNSGE